MSEFETIIIVYVGLIVGALLVLIIRKACQ